MRKDGLFTKRVHIRLADDGTGFLYTVKYGCFSLRTRQMRLFEQGDTQLGPGVLLRCERFAGQPGDRERSRRDT